MTLCSSFGKYLFIYLFNVVFVLNFLYNCIRSPKHFLAVIIVSVQEEMPQLML